MKIYPQHKRFAIFILVLFTFAATGFGQGVTIVISNPTASQRSDELIVLKRSAIEKKTGPVKFITVTAGNKEVIVQHDDTNGDGKWDEAVFLYSFKPKESATIKILSTNVMEVADEDIRAHVRLRKKNPDDTFGPSVTKETMPLRNPATDFSKQALPNYLTEGPAWENDKVAFRLYLDVRNNKDIFGKRTARMMMDTVGVDPKVIYHHLDEWGMDILHVVKSLGAGALALSVPRTNGNDTLVRLGGQDVKGTFYRQIADGPVRAIFEVSYDWEIDGKPVQVIEQTSIWGGQYFYESRITVSGTPSNTKLVMGIASFYHNFSQSFKKANTEVLLSHGRQSENKDYLGMAILAPSADFAYSGATPNEASEILNTFISAQQITAGKPCIFRFYACWEKTNERFASLSYFKDFLSGEAKKIDRPILVK